MWLCVCVFPQEETDPIFLVGIFHTMTDSQLVLQPFGMMTTKSKCNE